MRSILTEDFLTCFTRLPDEVRAQARRAYRLWRDNPSHRGLRFKRFGDTKGCIRCELAGIGAPFVGSSGAQPPGFGSDRTRTMTG